MRAISGSPSAGHYQRVVSPALFLGRRVTAPAFGRQGPPHYATKNNTKILENYAHFFEKIIRNSDFLSRPPLGSRGLPTVPQKVTLCRPLSAYLAGSLRQPLKRRKARTSPPPLVCLCWLPAPTLRSAGGQPQSAGSLRPPLEEMRAAFGSP